MSPLVSVFECSHVALVNKAATFINLSLGFLYSNTVMLILTQNLHYWCNDLLKEGDKKESTELEWRSAVVPVHT